MRVALFDDLNTHGAIVGLESSAKLLLGLSDGTIVPHNSDHADQAVLRDVAKQFVTGLDVLGFYDLLLKRQAKRRNHSELLSELHLKFVLSYELAKSTKDFTVVDTLKSQLKDAGVQVQISREGVELVAGPAVDIAALEALG